MELPNFGGAVASIILWGILWYADFIWWGSFGQVISILRGPFLHAVKWGIFSKYSDRNFFGVKSWTVTKISLNWSLKSQELSDTGRFFKISVMFFGTTVFLSAVLFSPLTSSNFCGVFCYVTGDKATICYQYQSLRHMNCVLSILFSV